MPELKKINMKDLLEIELREFKYLIEGINNSKNPYHFFYLSTSNNNKPQNRTIVLRNVDVDKSSIYFNADYRSPKTKQLIKNTNCSALFYDNKRKVQLRFNCESKIHYDNNISKSVWENTPLQSRKCYMGPYEPSMLIDEYHPNIPLEYLKKDPDEKDSNKGYKNFCHFELNIKNIDFLELHHDGHIRFSRNIEKNQMNYVSP